MSKPIIFYDPELGKIIVKDNTDEEKLDKVLEKRIKKVEKIKKPKPTELLQET